MVALSIIMRLAVRKIERVCSLPSMVYVLDQVLNIAPLVMLAFSFAHEFGGLPHATGVAFTLCAIVWGFGSIFMGLYTITDGQCYTVPIGFLMMSTSTITGLLYLLEGDTTQEVQMFATLTISTSVLFFTSRIHVNNNHHHIGKVAPSAARANSALVKRSGPANSMKGQGESAKSNAEDVAGKEHALPRASELVWNTNN